MFPARDVGGSVGSFAVADGKIDNPAVEFGCAEDKVEIAEGVEIAKIGAVGCDLFVVFTPEDFCAAEGIFDGLAEHP